ncbi:GntR family transcriptional regulator [Brevibacillus centrosporus]|uniref:Transcriptional regulator, GntR family n=1 Tax=Brevibacillus centrosporus TaxID=54910 RepID=A0A1I3QXQ4_9BACL|nr:GntR family transcriptional regulator [Brevibacillus centrosporus]MEC2129569.1 GntR family transcriptional regulator [Brevibacillus centrosporus]MED4908996.1 GntR family transcriptional regulator [Brevibacillus centrosporus]RNB65444.1 GntR family transcriptional regulator [Brevibacillus centrosporus]SFJ38993.1 transcriptional regulator, GntR family [Brevibacillus centrosporus]GED29923.1 GntR family transcriptional regulator [Brevibacillus centrosporus]
MKETKKTIALQLAEELSQRIARGILSPNEHLVETKLAEEFNTSRAPVREALLMLEKERLVTRVPHHGFVVKKFRKIEIHQLYDATFRLEEIAMAKAVNNVTDRDIQELEEILAAQWSAIQKEDVVEYYSLNEKFHETIFAIANNEFLAEMHHSMRRSTRPLSVLNIGQGKNMYSSYEEHSRQLDALKKRDTGAGIQAIRDQESRSLKTLDIVYPS